MKPLLGLTLLTGLALAGSVPAADKSTDDVQDLVFLTESRPVLVRVRIDSGGQPFHAAWTSFVSKVFTRLDKNKDGKLDRQEAARLPSPSTLFGGQPFAVDFSGEAPKDSPADLDKDGAVTEKELGAYFSREGGAAFGMTTNPNSGLPYQIIGRSGGTGSTTRLNTRLFGLLDSNHDGKLSARELGEAPTALARLDANEDELVTAEELLGEPEADGGEFYAVLASGDTSMTTTDNPLLEVPRSGKADTLAARLLSRYAGKEKSTTREQIGLDEADFKALDANADGKLDKGELEKFVRRAPDVELKVTLGARPKVELVTDPKKAASWGAELSLIKGENAPAIKSAPLPPAKTKPRDKDAAVTVEATYTGPGATPPGDRVRFKRGSTEFTLGLDGGSGLEMNLGFDVSEVWKMQFTQADGDNNSYIDEKEARGNPLFTAPFRQMDADGDGMVYLKEVLAWVKDNDALQKDARQACVALAVSDQGEGLFEMLDTNKDRRLGERELRQAGRLLSLLDGDKDGLVANREVPRTYKMDLRQGAVGGGNALGAVAFAITERSERVPGKKPTGPLWFHKMDRNGDGDVSPREFLGSPELFRRLDRDGDRLLSEAEATQAQPPK